MELLYIQHPNAKVHQNQVDTLAALKDPEKSDLAQLLRFGNASMHYYLDSEPTNEDYEDWLAGLPEPIKTDMRDKGFDDCKSVLGLQRHTLERKDIGMEEYVKNLLTQDDYEAWKKLSTKK